MKAEVPAVSPQALERLLARIPLAQAMRLRITAYEGGRLTLTAPFEPNRNHAGIAFGGAIECLGTLACWGLVWLLVADAAATIVVQHAETTFRTPLGGELSATAHAPGADELQRFRDALTRRGRARIGLDASVGDAATPDGAEFRGRFAVSLTASQEPAASTAKASSGSKR